MAYGLNIFTASGQLILDSDKRYSRMIYYTTTTTSGSVTLTGYDSNKGTHFVWPITGPASTSIANILSWDNTSKVLNWQAPSYQVAIYVIMYA